MRTLLRMSAQKSQTIWCQEQMSSASGKIPWRLKCTRIHVPQLFRRKELGSLLQKGNPLACRYAIREKMRIVNTNFRGITNAYIRRFSHCDDRTLTKCTELWSLAYCWWRSIFKLDLSPWNSICLGQRLRELCRQKEKEKVVINPGIKSTLVEMDLKMLLIWYFELIVKFLVDQPFWFLHFNNK